MRGLLKDNPTFTIPVVDKMNTPSWLWLPVHFDLPHFDPVAEVKPLPVSPSLVWPCAQRGLALFALEFAACT